MNVTSALELAAESREKVGALPRADARSVRALRRQYSKTLTQSSAPIVLRFVRSLLRGAAWAERVLAFEVLAAHAPAFALVDDQLAEEMAVGLMDWASVDLYGVTVIGQAWRAGQVSDAKVISWATSDNRWRRRLALVATVPLNIRARGGNGDAARTLRVCELLLADSDPMVIKALSWSLRELAKRDPAVVEAFLLKEEHRIAARVRREVWNKLRTGLKTLKVRKASSPASDV
jgi:3-methyladenine DNA glycosylase AlkD